MLINYYQLLLSLQKSWKPPYILFGDELLLIEKAKTAIYIEAKNHGFGYKKLFNLDGISSTAWQQMYAQINTPSLFDGNCLVYGNLPNGKPGKYGSEMLKKIAQNSIPCVIILPKLDKTTQNSLWFSSLKQFACCVEIPIIDNKSMPKWIEFTAKELNLAINNTQIISWLCERFNGNLIAAYQEMQKLSLIYPTKQELSLEQVQNVVADISEHKVFELVEVIFLGKLNLSLKIINSIQQDSPVLCMWLIIEQLILIIKIKQQIKQGQNFAALCKSYRIWGNKEQAINMAVKNLSMETLYSLLDISYTIEKQVKGVEPHADNLWESIQWLVIKICQEYKS